MTILKIRIHLIEKPQGTEKKINQGKNIKSVYIFVNKYIYKKILL